MTFGTLQNSGLRPSFDPRYLGDKNFGPNVSLAHCVNNKELSKLVSHCGLEFEGFKSMYRELWYEWAFMDIVKYGKGFEPCFRCHMELMLE